MQDASETVLDDDLRTQVEQTIVLAQAGDAAAARARGEALWARLQDERHALLRCLLAHHLADVQEDVREELAWDLRALTAVERVTEEDARRHHAELTVGRLLPSLHLNVADARRRLGETVHAREAAARASAAVDALPEDGYGAMIRAGIARLLTRLDAHTEADADADSDALTEADADAGRAT